jgi:hypothetical protein
VKALVGLLQQGQIFPPLDSWKVERTKNTSTLTDVVNLFNKVLVLQQLRLRV